MTENIMDYIDRMEKASEYRKQALIEQFKTDLYEQMNDADLLDVNCRHFEFFTAENVVKTIERFADVMIFHGRFG